MPDLRTFGHQHIEHNVDVCIVGGGMAGLCAAIASARHGAKTLLVHDRPVLGGNASSEVRMWICGAHGKNLKEAGLLEEIQLDNQHRNPAGNYSIWDSVLWEKATFQPGLTMLLNSSCVGCEVEGSADDRRISAIHAWQLTSQTWHTIEAKVFIDSSGDSALAPPSGAAFRTGRESRFEFDEDIQPSEADEKTMGNSLLIQLRKTDKAHPFTPPKWAWKFEGPEDVPFRMKGVQGTNFWWIELGGLQNTISDADAIRDDLMRAAWGVWDYIKNRAPGREEADTWALEWLGSLPGKRENRRYEGLHMLTQNDIRAGGAFDDVVAYGGWTMDDHHPAGLLYPGKPTIFHPAPSPYGIPLRCLVSRNVRNLMFAGRNISVTHAALSSTRVMGTTSILGQAAGTAAAMAVKHGVKPVSLCSGEKLREVQHALMDDDAYLPPILRPIDDLTRAGALSGDGAEGLLSGVDRPMGDEENAALMPIGQPVSITWDKAQDVGGVRLVFDSNLDHVKRMPCRFPQQSERTLVPDSLVRSFRIETCDAAGKWSTSFREQENHQRLVRVPVQQSATGVRLIVESTWGGSEAARVFAFEATRKVQKPLPTPPDGVRFKDVVAAVDPQDLAPPEGDHTSMPDPGAAEAKPSRAGHSA